MDGFSIVLIGIGILAVMVLLAGVKTAAGSYLVEMNLQKNTRREMLATVSNPPPR